VSELETKQYHYKSAVEVVRDLWKKMPHHDTEMSLDCRVEETLTSAVANQLRNPKCIPTSPFFSYLEMKIANSFLPK